MCCRVYRCGKSWQSFAWKGYWREIERAKSWPPSSPQAYSVTSEGTYVDIVKNFPDEFTGVGKLKD